ncbi:MAG: 2TM domain-containing protein [Cyanobacteria bacterium J06627_32]
MKATDYSTEDVKQILAIAMGRESSSELQLREMAQDLSIDDADLNYAMEAWTLEKTQQREKRQRRQRFYRYELMPYLAVNTLLIGINISVAGAITWAIYPLLGWGAGLLLLDGTLATCRSRPSNRCSRLSETRG